MGVLSELGRLYLFLIATVKLLLDLIHLSAGLTGNLEKFSDQVRVLLDNRLDIVYLRLHRLSVSA